MNGVLVQGFLYEDQLNPVAELDGNGNIVARFIYGTRDNIPDYMVRGGTTYRVIADHLGSPRLVIDVDTGVVAQTMAFDEFGRMPSSTKNLGFQPFGFAGGLYDPDTGLVRFGARDYDSEVGRWTSKDSSLFSNVGTNLYEYVLNDPINLVDPTGNGWKEIMIFLLQLGSQANEKPVPPKFPPPPPPAISAPPPPKTTPPPPPSWINSILRLPIFIIIAPQLVLPTLEDTKPPSCRSLSGA
jgi:RHS repeat-associated protein